MTQPMSTAERLRTVIGLIDADIVRKTQTGKQWPIAGCVICPNCGGDVDYVMTSVRALAAGCTTCGLRVSA